MVRGTGKPDQRTVAARGSVDPLRVRRRHIAQDLDLCLDHAEWLGVRAAHGSPGALDRRRLTDLLLPEGNDLFHELVEIRSELLHLRRIADEIPWHISSLLVLDRVYVCEIPDPLQGRER